MSEKGARVTNVEVSLGVAVLGVWRIVQRFGGWHDRLVGRVPHIQRNGQNERERERNRGRE